MSDVIDHVVSQLEAVYGGRRWILAFDILAATPHIIEQLTQVGATEVFAIGARRGTGEIPEADHALLGLSTVDGMMEGIRTALDALAEVPANVRAQVDAFDPTADALTIGTIFDDGRPVAGRHKFGARSPAWRELEDKTTVDALWDAAGLARAPSRVVTLDHDALADASADLDRGDGCVWAADSRDGFHGGASMTRWLRPGADVRATISRFEGRCDHVRIMPFVEGIPCSIHGIVLADHVVALRPCEMYVLRGPEPDSFSYAKAGTFWDPPQPDREAMREGARRVGEHLRRTVGYRGAFTIDGVLGRDGFVPTELNPRLGAALFLVTGASDLPLLLFDTALRQGISFDIDGEALEERLLEIADAHRGGSLITMTSTAPDEEQALLLVADGDSWRDAEADDAPHVKLVWGPGPNGGVVRGKLFAEHTPVGPPTGPRVASLLAHADRVWSLGLGRREPARPVR